MPTLYDEKTIEQEYKTKQEHLDRIKSRAYERLTEINHIFGEITYDEFVKEVDGLNKERYNLIQLLKDIQLHEINLWEDYQDRNI